MTPIEQIRKVTDEDRNLMNRFVARKYPGLYKILEEDKEVVIEFNKGDTREIVDSTTDTLRILVNRRWESRSKKASIRTKREKGKPFKMVIVLVDCDEKSKVESLTEPS